MLYCGYEWTVHPSSKGHAWTLLKRQDVNERGEEITISWDVLSELIAPVNLDTRRAKHLLEHGSLPSVYEILKAKRLERGRFKTDKERVASKQKFQPFNW